MVEAPHFAALQQRAAVRLLAWLDEARGHAPRRAAAADLVGLGAMHALSLGLHRHAATAPLLSPLLRLAVRLCRGRAACALQLHAAHAAPALGRALIAPPAAAEAEAEAGAGAEAGAEVACAAAELLHALAVAQAALRPTTPLLDARTTLGTSAPATLLSALLSAARGTAAASPHARQALSWLAARPAEWRAAIEAAGGAEAGEAKEAAAICCGESLAADVAELAAGELAGALLAARGAHPRLLQDGCDELRRRLHRATSEAGEAGEEAEAQEAAPALAAEELRSLALLPVLIEAMANEDAAAAAAAAAVGVGEGVEVVVI